MKRTHTCDNCGASGHWGDGWRSYGAYLDMEIGTLVKLCPACEVADDEAKALNSAKRIARYGTDSTRRLFKDYA